MARAGGRQLALAALIIAVTVLPQIDAQLLFDEETQRLMVEAVESATELDLYNARCRSDLSGRQVDNLNKELVSKFRMTVLEVEDNLFPEQSYRQAKERLEREFLTQLKQVGGCQKAKRSGYADSLRKRYADLMGALEQLP